MDRALQLATLRWHFARMWPLRHTSEHLRRSLRDNLRGQRG